MKRLNTVGFTLFETLMSVVLLLLIAGLASPILSSSKSLLSKHSNREEAIQNSRVVLRRLVREARYATIIYTASSGTFEMGSVYLINADSSEEKVRYRLQNGSLLRGVDTGGGYGADTTLAEKITSFVPSYNDTTKMLTFTVTATSNGKSYTGEAQVRPRSL